MPTPVFPLTPSYSLTHEISYDTTVARMGDGFEQRVNKNIAWGSRGDGRGNTGGTAYKGVNKFTLTFKQLPFAIGSSTALMNKLWIFYVARLGGTESFYFYNPIEAPIDPSGASVTGRYLVRFTDHSLSRDLFAYNLFSAGLSLTEVRT